MTIVVDASVALRWVYDDPMHREQTGFGRRLPVTRCTFDVALITA
jgi:hypothetical protein